MNGKQKLTLNWYNIPDWCFLRVLGWVVKKDHYKRHKKFIINKNKAL